jgi:hypothetical protein
MAKEGGVLLEEQSGLWAEEEGPAGQEEAWY